MKEVRVRGRKATESGLASWEAIFTQRDRSIESLRTRQELSPGSGGTISAETIRKIRKGGTADERTLRLFYALLDIEAREGEHYTAPVMPPVEVAPPTVVPLEPGESTMLPVRRRWSPRGLAAIGVGGAVLIALAFRLATPTEAHPVRSVTEAEAVYRSLRAEAGPRQANVEACVQGLGAFAGPFSTEEFEAVAGKEAVKELPRFVAVGLLTHHQRWEPVPATSSFATAELAKSGQRDAVMDRFVGFYCAQLRGYSHHTGQVDVEPMRALRPNWEAACKILVSRAASRSRRMASESAATFHSLQKPLYHYQLSTSWNPESIFVPGLATFTVAGAWNAAGDCVRGLAFWDLRTGRKMDALAGIQRAFVLYSKGGDAWGKVEAKRVEAEILTAMGRLPEAAKAIRVAIDLCPQNDLWLRGMAIRAQGCWLQAARRLREADLHFQQSRDLFTRLELPACAAGCTMGLADNALARSDLAGARNLAREALHAYEGAADVSGIVAASSKLAWISHRIAELNNPPNADELIQEASDLVEKGRRANEKLGNRTLAEDMDRLAAAIENRQAKMAVFNRRDQGNSL